MPGTHTTDARVGLHTLLLLSQVSVWRSLCGFESVWSIRRSPKALVWCNARPLSDMDVMIPLEKLQRFERACAWLDVSTPARSATYSHPPHQKFSMHVSAGLDSEWQRHCQAMGELHFYGQKRLDDRLAAHRAEMKRKGNELRRSTSAAAVSHRTAPTLAHRPPPPPPPPLQHGFVPPHHRSAPELPTTSSGPSRVMPSNAASLLLPRRVRDHLIERARASPAELSVYVEMSPVKSRQLHQSREQYEQHLSKLTDALKTGMLRSTRFPEAVGFRMATCELLPDSFQHVWAAVPRPRSAVARTGAAVDDYRQHATRRILREQGTGVATLAAKHQLASNQSWVHGAPLRHGAFEVYLVVDARGCGGQPRVELLFSKLFSRCWPRASAMMARVRKAIDAEMREREERQILLRATSSGEPSVIRAALAELTVLADSPAAEALRRAVASSGSTDRPAAAADDAAAATTDALSASDLDEKLANGKVLTAEDLSTLRAACAR